MALHVRANDINYPAVALGIEVATVVGEVHLQ
jgi:hypothetical protein